MTVAITGFAVVFTAANAGILLLPFAARPIEGSVFTHAKVVPVTGPAGATAATVPPLHTTLSAIASTVGVGLTVIVKFLAGPVQLFAEGVTVIVAITGAFVVLVAINDAILPTPVAANPIDGAVFTQMKPEPLTAPVKFTEAVEAPLHNTWLDIASTPGVGLTVMLNVLDGPVQPFADGVTVIVAVTGAFVVLVAANEAMLPVPFAARPIDVALLVHA